MKVHETDNENEFDIEFETKEEFEEFKKLTLKWSGKQRFSHKQFNDFINHILRQGLEAEKNGKL